MNVLITGAQGFTGRYVREALESYSHSVTALKSNLMDADAVAAEVAEVQPDAVVHLAAIAFVGHGNTDAFYQVNLIGTRHLLEALAQHAPQVRSVLLASSANVYGNQVEGALSEDIELNPANDYAVSKWAMEKMAGLYKDKLPLFIVRPFNYTGVGQDENFLVPKIVAHFRQQKTQIELGNLDVWREFGDVRSVADIYRQLLELTPRGETLNIGTGKAYSLREVIALCEKITQHQIEVCVNSLFVRENEVKILKSNPFRLQRLIDSHLTSYDLEDTLRWMLAGDSL
ncbi:MAG: NAD-dependent epimerase/dehydratase family protein [Gammaproteobacteria bacterium]|nr:NAD-dependent epimerase/dehydratase family protein [Gammaproteobacteria bacterium]